ncbi:MAG: class I SAM-dependent methyltransferase [Owenweeksia sp.]
MIEEKNCPVCGASSFKTVRKAPYFRGKKEFFTIQECQECRLWITNPRPENKELAKYYESEDYVSHTDKKETLVDRVYHMVRNFAVKGKIRLINNHTITKGSLLDYGAGTGFFLRAAKKDGWEVTGVEPSLEARKNAKQNHSLDLVDPEKYDWGKGNHIDTITLWHVLEHLPGLNDHIQNFHHALKPGGKLIIAVPNHESYDALKYKDSWAALDVPLHLYHFKKRNMEDIAKRFGFSIRAIKNMPFDSFYVSMLSEKVAKGKVNYLRAMWTGLVSNLKAISHKNASSLIYILEKTK